MGKTLVKIVVVVLVLIIALVALGPTLLGVGPGKALVAGAVEDRVNGTVVIDSASFGWFGGQSIEGLLIRDDTGREAVNVNVAVARGLVSLLLGPDEVIPIALSGRVAGELREDGSTSFQDLVAAGAGAGGGGDSGPKDDKGDDEPFSLAGVPPFALEIADFAVTLDLAGETATPTLTLDRVSGHAHYNPGGKLDLLLSTPTTSGALRGSIDVKASATTLFDAQGAMRPAGAVVDVNITTQSLPVPFADDVEELRSLVLTATAKDLSEKLDVTIHADTRLANAEPSVLDGTLAFAAPFTAAGAMRVGLDTIQGELTGTRVPTALLQPALAGSPIVLARDIGPSVDVTAGFAPAAGASAQTNVSFVVKAAVAALEMQAIVGADGAIAGERLWARTTIAPELAGGAIESPTPVTLELASFTLPARGADGALPLERIAFAGKVTLDEGVAVAMGEDADPLAVKSVRLAFESRALGDGLTMTGGATVAGSEITLAVAAVLAGSAVRVDSTDIRFTATPELVKTLQAKSEDPIELLAPSVATLTLAPFTLPEEGNLVINGRLTLDQADVRSSAITEPLRIGDLGLDLVACVCELEQYTVQGQAILRRTTGGAALGTLTCAVTAARKGESLWPTGTVGITKIAVAEFATLLGHDPEAVAGWLGSTGAVNVVLGGEGESRDVTLDADLPNLRGTLRAGLSDEQLDITAEDLRLTVAKGVLEKALAPKPDADAPAGGAPTGEPAGEPRPGVKVAGDVPLTVAVKRITIPMGLVNNEAFDPAAFELDAKLSGGPLTLVHPGDVVSSFREMAITLATSDLAEGVRFGISGKAGAGESGAPGGFAIDGTVTGLMTAASTFDPSGAAITTEGKVERMPTSIGDAFLDLEGLLVAAVGEEMGAAFRSSQFSKQSGWLDGRIDVPQGFVEARLRGQEDSLRTSKTRPFKGELALTPSFRDRLLAPIHPILRDVRTTEQPIRFSLGDGAWLPLDGDLSRLKADFEITIGKVEFDSGSTMLGLLSLFATPKSVIPGSIDPIVGRIRDGIVEYERFTVRIDQYELAYTGRVDLVKRTLDLRTELPLKALGASFKELEGYADKIVVPLVTRGTFEKNKTEIDPDFDLAGAAIQSGFGGAIDNLLKGKEGEGAGKLLGDLLGGKKDEEKPAAPEEKPKKKKKKDDK